MEHTLDYIEQELQVLTETIRQREQHLQMLHDNHARLLSMLPQERREPYKYNAPYNETKRDEVMSAYNKGYSTRQIEMLTGVGRSTVSRWTRQYKKDQQ